MTKIKICGLMTAADAAIINQAKPDYAGVVFAPGRHQVDSDQARAIRATLDSAIPLVGVFVATPVEEILAIAEAGIIQLVQLHGQSSFAAVAQIEAAGFPVIEVGLQGEFSSEKSAATYRLIDSGQGSGRPLAWDQFAALKKENLFVAGGLNRANLAQAIQTLSPYAVDISSGSELAGQKNLAIIEELVAIAHRNQE